MRAVDILRTKRDGKELSAQEIEAFVRGVTDHSWPDYQAAALLMAIVLRGMTSHETAHLTRAMAHSGTVLDWSDVPGPKIDKHSSGGVGDKTTLVLVPLAAACGVIVPKMSGRGLGHTGGTVDKLEAIPGFRAHLEQDEFRAAVREVGCAIIGQTASVAPADKVLYALRDVTATVESIPLITASILSKKIAEGIDGLVLDVKCGDGAFMKTRDSALELARSLVSIGRESGVKTEAIVTDMDVPLGRTVGNALEVKESIEALRGEGPRKLAELATLLAARMLILGGLATDYGETHGRIREALTSGRGLAKLRQIIERQGGDTRVVDEPRRLPQARQQMLVRAERPGIVVQVHAEQVGHACMLLGAGRQKKEDAIDPAVGAVIHAERGMTVREGDVLAEVHVNDTKNLPAALATLRTAWRVADEPPTPAPLVLEVLPSTATSR